MRNGICPKCGSEEVYSGAATNWKTNRYGMNQLPIKHGLWARSYSSTVLDNYVCVACGYVESYIADRAKLEEIAKYWPKVQT